MILNKVWFESKITSFLKVDESNKMMGIDGIYIFEPNPLVGLVSGFDPIFDDYKDIIGSFHLTPSEAYEKYCAKKKLEKPERKLVILSYILPINKLTKEENFKYSLQWPSERWAHTRLFGEQANQTLQKFLVTELEKIGIHAIAPSTEVFLFKIHRKHEKGVWASTWSHRHMAFAAGLGSFGLSDGFINERGKAMRCGSVLINGKVDFEPLERPKNPYQFCSRCGNCIERCPVGAISFENRHDKQVCSEHVMASIPIIKRNYGINIYSCGLCQVNVSCENGIPKK